MTEQPTFVDLFCGAGGLSWGFVAAGFEALLSLDNSKSAVKTHRANFPSQSERVEIGLDTELPKAAVIIGGPPCQGFSSAGLRRHDDARNSLVSVFSKLVARVQPQAFVFENVEGFLTAGGGQRLLDLLEPVLEAGYLVHLRKINAANYGIPQHRKRVLAIGGLGWAPSFPGPTHSAFGAPGADSIAQHLPPCPTLDDALTGLPVPTRRAPGEPQGHYYRAPSEVRLKRIAALDAGETMRDLPEELQHDSYTRRANRRVRDGTPTERRGGAPSGLRRLHPDEPSKTITSGSLGEFIHPYEDRHLTLRECARIQTFSDDFVFCGSRSQQVRLIGNAVPPKLAEIVARGLLLDLQERADEQTEPGRLLSFVPTHATGMSPALQNTTDVVHDRFGPVPTTVEDLPLWR